MKRANMRKKCDKLKDIVMQIYKIKKMIDKLDSS